MDFQIILSVFLAIGLAAASGFRVFVPLFAVSLMSHFGVGTFGLADNFEWIGSMTAIITFGGASLIELAAYYIPYVDNLLDTIAVPLAAVAGTLISMSTLVDIDPLAQWSIAIIAGGGLAGLIKGTGAATRAASTAVTGGVANPIVSTVETGASVALTAMAVFIPVIGIIAVALILFLIIRTVKRLRKRKSVSQEVALEI